jgi:hypothetical protein
MNVFAELMSSCPVFGRYWTTSGVSEEDIGRLEVDQLSLSYNTGSKKMSGLTREAGLDSDSDPLS